MKLLFRASFTDTAPTEKGWPIVFIDEGEVQGRGWGIWEQGLQASLPKFENVWVQSFYFEGGKQDHLPDDVRAIFPSGVITSNIVGIAGSPQLELLANGEKGITGLFRPGSEKINNLLVMAQQAGKLHEFYLSINGDVTDDAHLTPRQLASGRTITEVLEIDELYSTDMVTHPGRGGGFRDMLASAGLINNPPPPPPSGGISMRQTLKTYLDKKGIPFEDGSALSILASLDPESLSEADSALFGQIKYLLESGNNDAAEAALQAVLASLPEPETTKRKKKEDDNTPQPDAPDEPAGGGGEPAQPAQPVQASEPTLKGQMSENQILNTKLRVRFALDEEKGLKDSTKTLIASKLDGQILTDEQIQAEIDSYKQILAAENPDAGKPRSLQTSTGLVTIGLNPTSKIQQACDQLFGVVPEKFKAALRQLEEYQGITPEESMERYGLQASAEIPTRYEVPRIRLKQLYIDLTGDTNISFNFSSPYGRQRLLQASTIKQTTLPYAVGVSLNRRLVQDWMPKELPWRKIGKVKPDGLNDFREQQIIRVSGWANWRTVAEGDEYLELAVPTEVKETYTPLKKGELLPITREMIMRDDIRLVDSLLMKFRMAGQNTFHQEFFHRFVNYVTAAVNDGTMGDGNPVYDAVNHGNLKDAAITHPNMLALKNLIRAQKAEGSDIWLQLQGKYVVCPLTLEDQNLIYVVSERVPNDIINDANVLRIKEENALVIDDGLLESSDYIYMSVDPSDHPTIEVGFINNQQVPEMFVQDDPTMGNAFLKDIFTWKGRLEFGTGWEDYRGVARLGTAS